MGKPWTRLGIMRMVFVLLSAAALPAAAQVCTPGSVVSGTITNQGHNVVGTSAAGQTFFAPGTTGECVKLNQVTLSLCKFAPPNNLTVEIRDTSGFAPGASVLATTTVPSTAITTDCGNGTPSLAYGPVAVTFAIPPSLVAGTKYAVVVRQIGGSGTPQAYRMGLIDPGVASVNYCTYDGSSWTCPGNGRDSFLSICTSACCTSGCTRTQGYWKNHEDSWPVGSLTLGTVSYTQTQLLAILDQPVAGNGLISLAHQLIAAKLNTSGGGCVPQSVTDAIAAADALIGALVVPPVGSGWLDPSVTGSLNGTLDTFNNGCTAGGPPHCDQQSVCPLTR